MEAQGSELVTMELGTTEAADLFNAVRIYTTFRPKYLCLGSGRWFS